MGASQSDFSDEELERYEDETFFTKKEILHIYKRYKVLDKDKEAQNYKCARMSKAIISELTELKENPFCSRMCDVYSSSDDGSLSFEDFLELMSVFSEAATKRVKMEAAFKIYDFDGDNLLSKDDIKRVIELLTGDKRLTDDEMQPIVENIMTESDFDGDGALSFAEFQNVLSKSPDFFGSFHIQL